MDFQSIYKYLAATEATLENLPSENSFERDVVYSNVKRAGKKRGNASNKVRWKSRAEDSLISWYLKYPEMLAIFLVTINLLQSFLLNERDDMLVFKMKWVIMSHTGNCTLPGFAFELQFRCRPAPTAYLLSWFWFRITFYERSMTHNFEWKTFGRYCLKMNYNKFFILKGQVGCTNLVVHEIFN